MSAFIEQLTGRPAAAALLVINLLTATLMLWLAWTAVSYVESAARIGRASSALQVPLHYIYLLIPLGLGMSGLQFMRHAVIQLLVVLGSREAPSRHTDTPLPSQD
jgi:TRAP-type C4-dicarboxylate transport system permease small subunit